MLSMSDNRYAAPCGFVNTAIEAEGRDGEIPVKLRD